MASFNKVILIGNLTRDPELRATASGKSICAFSLAINRRYTDSAGAAAEEVTYVDVEAWGKAAEAIAKYVAKGRPLMVEGRLKLDQWEDRTTKEKRSRLKVVCENFQFLGARPESAQGTPGAAPKAENPDEDVPF